MITLKHLAQLSESLKLELETNNKNHLLEKEELLKIQTEKKDALAEANNAK